jgi:hypothetical protein
VLCPGEGMSLLLMVFACATTSGPAHAPPPAVAAENPSASGDDAPFEPSEDAAAVKKVVKQQSGQVKYCYESQLKHDPTLGGRIEISFTVEAGRVTDVRPSMNTTGNDAVAECIAAKVMAWRFTEDVSGEFTYPFTLIPAPSTRSEAGRD